MRKPFDGDFPITQNFADPRYADSYHQFGLYAHNGIDYGCPNWTPILAPHKGTVLEATNDPIGYGNYVKVQSDNEGSVLAHLSKISVTKGQQVNEGDVIGYSGNSGNSTGPHLHWGYYRSRTRNRSNGFNGYIDQIDWLDRAIIVQPTAQTFNDQTIIPKELLGEDQDLEIQQIRGYLLDGKRDNLDLQNTRKALEDEMNLNVNLANKLKECQTSVANAPKTADYSKMELLTMLINKLFFPIKKVGD